MDGWREKIEGGLADVRAFVQRTRDSYDGATRFSRMRIWILGIVGLDVVATLAALWMVSGPAGAFDVDAWFERSFPSNMIVVRNKEGEALNGVTFVLDGRYRLEVETLNEGVEGFEVEREFMDAERQRPSSSYRPKTLEIRVDDRAMQVAITEHVASN